LIFYVSKAAGMSAAFFVWFCLSVQIVCDINWQVFLKKYYVGGENHVGRM